jgi:hypothetical protein
MLNHIRMDYIYKIITKKDSKVNKNWINNIHKLEKVLIIKQLVYPLIIQVPILNSIVLLFLSNLLN